MPVTRRGITLVEVLIASAVLLLALVPIVNLLSGVGRQARQTADYGQALALASKVSDELRSAAWDNVHYPDQIRDDASFGPALAVVDGGSPFFAALEDRVAPLGRIRVGEDPGITRDQPALYRQLASYRMAARPLPGSSAGPITVDVSAVWRDHQGQERRQSLLVTLATAGRWTETPVALQNRARADATIRASFYPTASGTLDDATRAAGADPATIRALGDLALVNVALADSDVAFLADETAFTAESREAGPRGARGTVLLARTYETRAALLLESMVALAGEVGPLARSSSSLELGSPPPPPATYLPAVLQSTVLAPRFADLVARARTMYATAYNAPLGPLLSPRTRLRVFMKFLELTKLAALTTAPGELATLQQALADFARAQDGVNPSLKLFADYEAAQAATMQALRGAYPTPERPAAWRTFTDDAGTLLGRVAPQRSPAR